MVVRFSRRNLILLLMLVSGVTVAVALMMPENRPMSAQAAAVSCEESVKQRAVTVFKSTVQRLMGSQTPQINDPDKVHIFIDRYTQRLTLYEGQFQVISYPVAVGKGETPTPPGEWRVIHKDKGWGGGFGTRWMGINVPWGIYGIHGTNKPWSIGTHASAGCIRMFNEDVEELFEMVPLGTPVVISGDLPAVAERPEIRADASGKFVLVVQVRLRQAGFDFGSIDGRFGPGVESGVRNFQALYGFPADGVVTRDQQRILWYPR